MAMRETIGEPIPKGIIGESYGDTKRTSASAEQLAEIRDELRQLSHTIAQLAESTTKYTQQRVQSAAQTAVDRYPVGSIALAALAGYWLASRRR